MSWSFRFKDTPEKVVEQINAQAASYIANAMNAPEVADVLAVRDRVVALSADMAGVEVYAYGSHSTTDDKTTHAQFHCSVDRVALPVEG